MFTQSGRRFEEKLTGIPEKILQNFRRGLRQRFRFLPDCPVRGPARIFDPVDGFLIFHQILKCGCTPEFGKGLRTLEILRRIGKQFAVFPIITAVKRLQTMFRLPFAGKLWKSRIQGIPEFRQGHCGRPRLIRFRIFSLIEQQQMFPCRQQRFQENIPVLTVLRTLQGGTLARGRHHIESRRIIPSREILFVQSQHCDHLHRNAPHRHQRTECDLAPQERFGDPRRSQFLFDQVHDQTQIQFFPDCEHFGTCTQFRKCPPQGCQFLIIPRPFAEQLSRQIGQDIAPFLQIMAAQQNFTFFKQQLQETDEITDDHTFMSFG